MADTMCSFRCPISMAFVHSDPFNLISARLKYLCISRCCAYQVNIFACRKFVSATLLRSLCGHSVANQLPVSILTTSHTCKPNFDEIPETTAETFLLPAFEIKRPTYWNSTSGVDFGPLIVTGMSFSIDLPNYTQIEPSVAEIWRHSAFPKRKLRFPGH